MSNRWFSLISLPLMVSACATLPAPVHVLDGTSADFASFSGEWYGSLIGADGTGSLVLMLVPGDPVGGELRVIMGSEPPEAYFDGAGHGRTGARFLVDLPITAVRIDGQRVLAEARSFGTAACGCVVRMVFSGQLAAAGIIEGTFMMSAVGQDGVPSVRTGHWVARRQPDAPELAGRRIHVRRAAADAVESP